MEIILTVIYVLILVAIFVIDLKHGLILNIITYPGMVLAAIGSLFLEQVGLASSLFGGFLGFFIMFLFYMICHDSMGVGDIKLGALIGMMVGFPMILRVLILAFIIGGLVGGTMIALKKKIPKDSLPFAPFLTVPTIFILVTRLY